MSHSIKLICMHVWHPLCILIIVIWDPGHCLNHELRPSAGWPSLTMSKLGNAGEFSRFKINPERDNYRLAWKLEIQLIKFKYQSLTRGIYIYTIQGYIYIYIHNYFLWYPLEIRTRDWIRIFQWASILKQWGFFIWLSPLLSLLHNSACFMYLTEIKKKI